MSLFYTEQEAERLKSAAPDSRQAKLYRALRDRAAENTAFDGWVQPADTQEWYHLCWERMMDASFVYAMEQDERIGKWIYQRTMETVRLDTDTWIGPWYRRRGTPEPIGALETAHITLAVCEAYENAPALFSEEEKAEIRLALREKGMLLCKRFAERVFGGKFVNNWHMVLMNGYGTAALVLGDEEEIRRAIEISNFTAKLYNRDSYGESVQYSNYASIAQCHFNEVMLRSGRVQPEQLNMACYTGLMRWYAYSFLHRKGLESLGGEAPRTINFGDCAAAFRPSGDVLAQVAVRQKDAFPLEAGLASWLFAQTYPDGQRFPDELATFGFFNQYEYTTVLMQPDMAAPVSPEEAKLPLSQRFECGHIISRDRWQSPRTTVAIAAGYDPYNVTGHRHLDQNSFQLIAGGERMLSDPGHCCYRLTAQKRSVSEMMHNNISLERAADACSLQPILNDPHAIWLSDSVRRMIGQKFVTGAFYAPAEPMNKLKLNEFFGDVQIVVSDATALYGDELEKVVRLWVMALPGMVFVADVVKSKKPVSLWSHFSLNNRDNALDVHIYNDHRLVFRRHGQAIKLFEALSVADGKTVPSQLSFDWSYMHDFYHPLPNQAGQGKEGSALVYNWRCPEFALEHLRIHTIAVSDSETIRSYHVHALEDGFTRIEAPDHSDWLDLRLTAEAFTVRRSGIGEKTYFI